MEDEKEQLDLLGNKFLSAYKTYQNTRGRFLNKSPNGRVSRREKELLTILRGKAKALQKNLKYGRVELPNANALNRAALERRRAKAAAAAATEPAATEGNTRKRNRANRNRNRPRNTMRAKAILSAARRAAEARAEEDAAAGRYTHPFHEAESSTLRALSLEEVYNMDDRGYESLAESLSAKDKGLLKDILSSIYIRTDPVITLSDVIDLQRESKEQLRGTLATMSIEQRQVLNHIFGRYKMLADSRKRERNNRGNM